MTHRRFVGPWELIPREQLAATDAIEAAMVEYAQGVAALYRTPGDSSGFGAFVRPPDLRVGDEVEEERLRTFHHSIVVALLDQNPSRADPDAPIDDYNAGHRMCTTENALLFGHRFGADLFTGFQTGTMVVNRTIGPRIGEGRDVIEPPSDMRLPIFRPQFDEVYAAAIYDVLTNQNAAAPDLPGAIRWLELAWTNSAAIDAAARVLALRAGFDVLFGGADTRQNRARLSTLLDEPDAQRHNDLGRIVGSGAKRT